MNNLEKGLQSPVGVPESQAEATGREPNRRIEGEARVEFENNFRKVLSAYEAVRGVSEDDIERDLGTDWGLRFRAAREGLLGTLWSFSARSSEPTGGYGQRDIWQAIIEERKKKVEGT
jgi:hypothetical protein